MRSQPGVRACVLGCALGLLGCESTPPMLDVGSDVPPSLEAASNANPAVFEGQGEVVSVLTVVGADLTGATVISESDGLVVLDAECAGERCGVVVAVPDTQPNVGRAIPAPIDATNHFLRIVQAGSADRRALFSVAPLDAIANEGDTATVRGVYFASSLSTGAATSFRGALGREPVRWFVFGDGALRGRVDVSADGSEPGPGGFSATTSSPANGATGDATSGGGGGGSASEGAPGEGASAGVGGDAFGLGCAADAFTVSCGGGAGGPGTGSAAAGAGAFSLVVLGTLAIGDAVVDAHGADGSEGGGGGGGGRVMIAATHADGGGITIDTSGGAGDPRAGSAGGDGADGESTVAFDLVARPARWIVRDPTLVLVGRGAIGGRIVVERIDGTPIGSADVGADGTFTVDVALIPGLNRLRVSSIDSSGELARLWSGNHLELERRGAELLPVGGLLDVAYLP